MNCAFLNVRGWEGSKEEVGYLLARNNIKVMGLVETWGFPKVDGYVWWGNKHRKGRGRPSRGEGFLVDCNMDGKVKKCLEWNTEYSFWIAFQQGDERCAMGVVYIPPVSASFSSLKWKAAYCGVQERMKWLNREGYRVVVGGDFNARVGREFGQAGEMYSNSVGRFMAGKLKEKMEFTSVMHQLGIDFHTSQSNGGTAVVDYVFTNKSDQVLDCVVSDVLQSSDHAMLMLTMEGDIFKWKSFRSEVWGFKYMEEEKLKEKDEVYCKALAAEFKGWKREYKRYKRGLVGSFKKQEIINKWWDLVVLRIIKCGEHAYGKVSVGNGSAKPWWNPDLSELKKEGKRAVREGWAEYSEWRSRYQKKKREAVVKWRRESRMKLLKKVKSRYGNMWKWVAKKRRKKFFRINNPLSPEDFADRYEELGEVEGEDDYIRRMYDWRGLSVERKQVKAAIKGLKTTKACGFDGLEAYLVKTGRKVLVDVLTDMFNIVGEFGHVPASWKKGVVTVLPKGGDPTKWFNYRPVTILSVAVKVFERCLKSRVTEAAEKYLDDNQFGFRKKRGVDLNGFLMQMAMDYARGIQSVHPNKKLYCALLDVYKAFDTVDHAILWEKCEKAGIEKVIIGFLEEFYFETVSMVVINGVFSREYEVKRGVKQGAVLSPVLFNIYVNEVLEVLRQYNKCKVFDVWVGGMMFADDLAVTSWSEFEMRQSLIKAAESMAKVKLKFSWAKCKMIVIGVYRRKVFKFLMEDIQVVNSVRYLGYWLDKDGNWLVHIRKAVEKAKDRVYSLNACGINVFGTGTRIAVIFLKLCVRTILEWGFALYKPSEAQFERMKKVLMRGLRFAMGVSEKTCRELMERVVGWESVRRRFLVLRSMMLVRVMNSESPAGTLYHNIRSRNCDEGFLWFVETDEALVELGHVAGAPLDKKIIWTYGRLYDEGSGLCRLEQVNWEGYANCVHVPRPFTAVDGKVERIYNKMLCADLPLTGELHKRGIGDDSLCIMCAGAAETTAHFLKCGGYDGVLWRCSEMFKECSVSRSRLFETLLGLEGEEKDWEGALEMLYAMWGKWCHKRHGTTLPMVEYVSA
eukprot:CAMPEP_0174276412 /NCGR_PEP_ID=MMETSP0439-20130205/60368_1 /TAXON_ID=0 /ORGANISM="Stereomyxa ramosa, Strain Chinc5" /LENGTH=1075 /DNA_ID=CAMNT_0015368631 /DNA_START=40 /DNA_END=3267 /DNA_ORIENTATION=-